MPPSFFPDALPPLNINTSLGAFEIGTLVAAFLFGATTVQAWMYFETYTKDRRLIKLMVALIWLLELAHTISICHAMYTMTITWYAKPDLLTDPPPSLDISILINAFIGPIEQAWFTRRLYIFSKNLWLTAICCLLSFSRLVVCIVFSIAALQRLDIVVFELKYWWILTVIVVLGSINDLILACSLGWYLYKHKKRSLKRVAKILDRLIIWAVETSAITTIATLAMMICFLTMPANFIYIAIYLCLAKIYANALLASLNARESFSQQFGEMISLDHLPSVTTRSRSLSRLSIPSPHHFRGPISDDDQAASPASASASLGGHNRYNPLYPTEGVVLKPTYIMVDRPTSIASS